MPIPTYISGYPPDGFSLGNTKTTIRGNLDGTFQTLGIQHYNQNSGNISSGLVGKHQYITFPQQGFQPTTAAGEIELFNGALPTGGNYNLAYIGSGSSTAVQLTRSEIPKAMQNGYSWMAGNILWQWGLNNAPSSGSFALGLAAGTYVFAANGNVDYSANPFIIQATLIGSSSAISGTGTVSIISATATEFKWAFNGAGTSYLGFYWTAIGI